MIVSYAEGQHQKTYVPGDRVFIQMKLFTVLNKTSNGSHIMVWSKETGTQSFSLDRQDIVPHPFNIIHIR